MPEDQQASQVDQPVQTGLAGLVLPEPNPEPQEPSQEKPEAPTPGVSLTAAEQREAEIAEGQRQNKRHEHLPQPEHPALTEANPTLDPNLGDAQQRAIDLLKAAVPARVKGETIEQRIHRQDAEGRVEAEQQKHDFVRRVLASRQQARVDDAPKAPQPIPPAISKQTEREMEAGRKANQKHAEFHAVKPMPPHPDPTTTPTGSVPVFRPADYVPNMKQGNVNARSLT